MKNIYRLIIALSFLGTFGCTDLLDQEPVSITHPDVFWSSQDDAQQALAGAYGLFKTSIMTHSNFLLWGEFPAMTFMNSNNWIVNYIEGSGNYVLAYRDPSRDWKNFYRAANWANTIEHYVEEMSVDKFTSRAEKNRIIGEAAFIRSLSYFWMARIWGNVPIVTESIETSDQLVGDDGYIKTIPRSNELDVLKHSLEAVDKSIKLLAYSTPDHNKWAINANKASAEALKAHICLWYAGRDKDNVEMVKNCIDAATSVIDNSNAELIDYVAEGKNGFDAMCKGQSKTGLFEINIDFGMSESFRMSSGDSYHTGLTLNYPIWKDKNTNRSPKIDPDFYGNEFMANDDDRKDDVRKDLFFYDYSTPDDNFLMKYSHQTDDPSSEDAYANFSESNILLMRLADIYLLRAEAYARQNKPTEAVADLDLIRSKANVPAYTGATDRTSLMKAIFEERAIEFVGEGQSAYDRIRMDYYFEGVPWMNQNRITKRGYFWPVASGIISVNPAIVQSEYWRGKL